jgi:hypothetical protein
MRETANLMSSDVVGLQTTISRSISLSGIGVHSGENVSITFHPADPDTGIVFNRHLPCGDVVSVRAVSSQVGSTDLCTLLGKAPDRSVATVEHLMAALYALGVDNISIELDGGEVPIMDGSAAVFIEAHRYRRSGQSFGQAPLHPRDQAGADRNGRLLGGVQPAQRHPLRDRHRFRDPADRPPVLEG